MSNPRTQQDWQAMAATLSIRTQAFIDGRYVDAASGKPRRTKNTLRGGSAVGAGWRRSRARKAR